MKFGLRYALLSFFIFIVHFLMGQGQVELLHADAIYYNKSLVDAQRLKGNVHFVRDGTHLYCDSAYWYAQKDFTAFGKISIHRAGEFQLTGKQMYYRNLENSAYVNGDVVLTDNDMVLTSPRLEYHLSDKTAHYSGGGKIVSKTKSDILTSQNGIYYTQKDLFHFEKNVRIMHEQYTLTTAKLDYEYNAEIAHFIAPTIIKSKDQKVSCNDGYFNSKTQQGELYNRPVITYEKTKLTGDTIYFDSNRGYGKAMSHIVIKDTTKQELILGNFAEHFQETGINIITKHPRIAEIIDEDTLWVQSDTIWMKEDSIIGDQIKAHHHVVLYHPTFQGRCDSAFFSASDSILTLFNQPIFWTENRQLTGDTIQLCIQNKQVKRFHAFQNAFVIGEVIPNDTIHYDQIKGRKMTGYFASNELNKIDVFGNGQLLYFPKNSEKDKKSMGMNKGDCSDITISIKDRKIRKINLKKKPDSFFIPMKKTDGETKKLPQFHWRIQEKPDRSCIKI